jgi:fructose-1,6-bisphosphatase/inositol monophosphatase family enzyme
MPPDLPLSRSGRTPLEVARRCAQEAARIVLDGLGKAQDVRIKGRGNLVTASDLASERAIHAILREEYPDHSILSEETAPGWVGTGSGVRGQGSGLHSSLDPRPTTLDPEGSGGGWLWVVDPLDGTRNYLSGIPTFCINIALCHDEEPLLALTFEPVRGEEFLAQRGAGATLNGRPMRASTKESVLASVLAVDLGYDDGRAARALSLVSELWPGMQSLRVIGSAALGLAYAACGRFDLFVHHMLYPWDIAAGILLVREAGGLITGRDGEPIGIRSEGVIAGAPGAHADFLRLAAGRAWR